jgi:hypothetical protein
MSERVYGGLHRELAEYFYDLVMERDADVPEAVSSHVRRCVFCREQIVRLKEAVLGARVPGDKRKCPVNHPAIGTLDSHFQLLEERVTCKRARPFLPGLLDPSADLRIPTPITVHVDQCPQCARDLRLLRDLNLGREQLGRLQWLYGRNPAGGLLLCRRARPRIAAFVRGQWEGIDGEVLNHLSTCPRCRAEVYARRQNLLDELAETPGGSCGVVAAAELFDCVVPQEDMIQGDKSCTMPLAGASRRGLETMQAMHLAIYGVAERAESGVATLYHIAEDDRSPSTRPDDPYAGYPIMVETVHHASQPAAPCSETATNGAPVNPWVRWILKAVVAAAAVIPLAVLFCHTHNSSGTVLAKAIRAFGQARNVRVVSLDPADDQVVYELWISRDLNLTGMMTARECVVYDLASGEKEDVVSGVVTPVGDRELANVREMGDHCLGFSLAGVPSDATWERRDAGGGREVYEFAWVRQTNRGRDIPVKYEVTIDTSTMLPASFRLFRREWPVAGWECQSLIVFEYPTEDRMRSVMAGKPLAGADGRR